MKLMKWLIAFVALSTLAAAALGLMALVANALRITLPTSTDDIQSLAILVTAAALAVHTLVDHRGHP